MANGITLKDVAALADVSLTTVSRVLNGSELVKEQTRREVMRVMNKLGYQPNVAARALVTRGKTKQLAIVVEDIRHPFFAECAAAFRTEAVAVDYTVLFMETREDDLVGILELLRGRQVEAIAVVKDVLPDLNDALATELQRLRQAGIAVCVATEDSPAVPWLARFGVSTVAQPTYGAARELISHLIEAGHSRIAYLGSKQPLDTETVPRYRAYVDTMRAHGLPIGPAWTTQTPELSDTPQAGADGVRAILAEDRAVTAVAVFNDIVAIGALSALYEDGLRVPDDISVTGFDDLPISRYTVPPLTTVHLERGTLGRQAVASLLAHLETGAPQRRSIATNLVIRASTAPPRSARTFTPLRRRRPAQSPQGAETLPGPHHEDSLPKAPG